MREVSGSERRGNLTPGLFRPDGLAMTLETQRADDLPAMNNGGSDTAVQVFGPYCSYLTPIDPKAPLLFDISFAAWNNRVFLGERDAPATTN